MRGTLSREVLKIDRRQQIDHVVLDMCGVLYDDSEWKRWLLGLVTRMGLHTHYAPFFRLWDREFQRDIWCGRRDFWSAYGAFLLAAGLSPAQIDEVAAATRAKLRLFDDRIRTVRRRGGRTAPASRGGDDVDRGQPLTADAGRDARSDSAAGFRCSTD